MRYPAPPSTATTKKLMTALSEYSLHFSSVVRFCCFFLRYCSSRSCYKQIKPLVNLAPYVFRENKYISGEFSFLKLTSIMLELRLTEFNDTAISTVRKNEADQSAPWTLQLNLFT